MSATLNTREVLLIDRPDGLDKLIAYSIAMGYPCRAELYRWVRQGRLLVMEVERSATFSMKLLKGQHKPLVVLLGDDDYRSTGPTEWASLPKILRWANRGLIHATGGDVVSYQMAGTMALVCQRLVLIETTSAYAKEWAQALSAARPPVPFVGLVPPAGGVHPVTPSRSEQQ